ncbi:hypothetical protein BKA65DRAFT_506280 [Rhexocercosporidium sp. MPI-PUGE-AT-0058]|nr:hypothetical protein BKA65DRAFT_506280 [Rhexocercosporidium sp. MPI-PUGE-AT-0058]
MQVLWSRAAQAKSSCSCRSCLHTATNLARRTTAAVGKRRVKVSDVVTACYSTILATAAVVDMRRKEERRKEWDRVIAEAKAGPPTLDTSSGRSDNIDAGMSDRSTVFVSSRKTSASNFRPIALSSTTAGPESALEIKLRKIGSRLEDEFSFVEEVPDLELPSREPVNPLHLERMQETIARLAYRFLTASKIFSADGFRGSDDMQLQTLQMKQRLQALMEGFSNLPSYEWNSIREVYDQRDTLNQSLHTLCRNTVANDRASINLMLAKVSYNLLVSTSPPSMVTYNVLLAEFIRLGKPGLAQIVVDSFMHDSKLKPNQTTVKLILDHYRAKGDANGFRSILLRMRATRRTDPESPFDRPDMRVRKRELKDLYKPTIQEWAMGTKTIHRNSALYEKTPRDAAIFDSLIKGCLQFQGLTAATRQIRCAFREGRRVHQDTLCSVIRACLDQANFSIGLKIIRNIISLWEDGVEHLVFVYSQNLRQLIHQLLVMCGFDTKLNSTKDLPIKASWDALQDLLHYMHIESIKDALDRCADFSSSLSQSLGLAGSHEVGLDSQEPLEIQPSLDADLAMHIVEGYTIEQQLRINHQRGLEAASRWTRLEALEILMDMRRTKVLDVETELTSLLYARLSHDQKAAYDRAVSQMDNQSPKTAYLKKRRILLQILKPEQEVSQQLVDDVQRSPLPKVREHSLALKEVSPRSTNRVTIRHAKSLPIRPLRSPYPISMPLVAMSEKTELEATAS